MARKNKKRKQVIDNEFNSNVAEGSSAAVPRQNTDQQPIKKAKVKQNTTKTRTSCR
jgi:hypothetical protein